MAKFTNGSPTKEVSEEYCCRIPIRSNPALQKAEMEWNTPYQIPFAIPNSRIKEGAMISAPSASKIKVIFKINPVSRTIPPTFGAEIASTLWGVNFIFSMFAASLLRLVIRRTGIDYTIDNGTLNRINGLSVDLTVTACLAGISLTALAAYYVPVIILILVGIVITCFILPWYSSRIYSDHAFFRMLVLFGTATGTLPTGLSLLRVVDPDFETPAAQDYAYASGLVFVFVFPLILFVNLPAYSYSQNNPALFYAMLAITGLYALVFIIAYRIVAGKRAWKSPRTFFLKED